MNCPHCGAHIDGNPDNCPLCGAYIDRQGLYAGFIKKGEEALGTPDYDKAMDYYQKALDTGYPPAADIYIKYGNAYDKKNDKQAAGMYLKALAFDFYNEHVHTLLIAFYDKYNRLNDLKKWYEKSRGTAGNEFIDKEIKVIDSIITFRQNAASKPLPGDEAKQKQVERAIHRLGGWFKDYIMMNIVFGIVIVLMGIGIAAGLIFKLNFIIIFAIIGFFLLASIAVVIFLRRKKIREIKKNAVKIEDIYREFKKP
jgi:tetratricopeptide (TPR) repeat protein